MYHERFALTRRGFLGSTCAAAGAALLPAVGRAEEAGKESRLRAGAAVSDITPRLGVSLDGTISQNGPAAQIHDKLHARCLALDDGRTRLAIAVCDATMISRDLFERAKALAHERTGLPTERMLFSATHTHSTPRLIGVGTSKLDREYEELVVERIADGVRRALENLAPARVGWGVGRLPELPHNRRWYMKAGKIPPDPFGGTTDQVRMNPPRGSSDILEPAGAVDPEVSVLSVVHADGRPLALLGNFGIHYVGGTGRGHVSADYFGEFDRRVADKLGAEGQDPPFVGVLSNGTSGDVSNGLPFDRRPERRAAYERIEEVAETVAAEAARLCGKIEHRGDVTLAMRETEMELGVRRPDEERIAWAKKVAATIKPGKRLTRPQVYAREALFLADYPATQKLKLQAVRIGDLGIAAVPCEVFAETGLEIKRKSPLEPTFTISLANGYNGYLPPPRHYRLGGYETWPARSSLLEVEAEPRIAARVLDLLKEVAGSGG